MDFDFDERVDRLGTDCIKWDAAAPGVLPMWIADMDFKAAPVIRHALQERVTHGIFGYTQTPRRFYEAIGGWWRKRHGLDVPTDWIIPVTGVIPALSAIVRALTDAGDKLLLQPPVYNHFFETAKHCGREVVESNLRILDGRYTIDFEDLEAKAADPSVKLFFLCNPHNPVGRAWTAEELHRVGEICVHNGVIVLSDEIHSDLVFAPHRHIPFASLVGLPGLKSITVSSPSKTFNLAGLQVGYLFSADESLRSSIRQVLAAQEMVLLNPFGIEALIAAYQHGADWLEALKAYLMDNFNELVAFCKTHLPATRVIALEATYLVWLDCRAQVTSAKAFADELLVREKLWLIPGTFYGAAGEGFLRINIACPRALLREGLERLAKSLDAPQYP